MNLFITGGRLVIKKYLSFHMVKIAQISHKFGVHAHVYDIKVSINSIFLFPIFEYVVIERKKLQYF